MPKKHSHKSLLTKPASGASSSLLLSRQPPPNNDSPRTVNELIRDSRKASGNSSRTQPTHSSSSVPPTVRAILDLPAPPTFVPRHGYRGPSRMRRIPGPPPPRSWLTDSIHAPRSAQRQDESIRTRRTRKQASTLPGGSFPPPRSLQDVVLRAMATSWQWHVAYDHQYLAQLPTNLKENLLSYIAVYNGGQGPDPLHILFPHDLGQDERNEVRRLDLSEAIGGWATVKALEKELMDRMSNPKQRILAAETSKDASVPDSWDLEPPPQFTTPTPRFHVDSGLRFRHLKHLSLAAVPQAPTSPPSWKDLMTLASKLSTITSLSLAFWPLPTYTPNASNGVVRVKASGNGSGSGSGSRPSVIYGGSDFYTAFENNWREAAGILRTLSRSLYCLQWLDLTGCSEWFPALVWEPNDNSDDDNPGTLGPDWNGSWRGLERLVLAVGWTPMPPSRDGAVDTTDEDLSEQDQEELRRQQMLARLSELRLGADQTTFVPRGGTERVKYLHRKEVELHAKLQNCARKVAQDIRITRKENGGRWLDVDFGED